jgi:hypothetical protein
MSREKQQGGKASDLGKNGWKSDDPKTMDQTVSPPSRLKLYLAIVLVLLLVLVAYIIRYEPICIFTCAPLFAPNRHYPTKVIMSEICGSPIDIEKPSCMTVPVVVQIRD